MQIYAITIIFNFCQDLFFQDSKSSAGHTYYGEIKLKECLGLTSPEAGNYSKTCFQRKFLPPHLWLLLSCSTTYKIIYFCLFCVLFWFLFWDPDIALEFLGTLGESSRGGFFSPNQQPFQLCAFAFCFSQCEHHLGFLRFLYLLSAESDLFLPVHGICFSCRLFGINWCHWSFYFCCSHLLQMYLMLLVAADSRILL